MTSTAAYPILFFVFVLYQSETHTHTVKMAISKRPFPFGGRKSIFDEKRRDITGKMKLGPRHHRMRN